MAAVSNSVVHLTMRFGKTELSIGTGMVYLHQGEYFIVTAWHNLSGLHSETLRPLSDNLAIPDNVVVNFAVNVAGGMTVRYPIVLPLVDEEKSLFFVRKDNWPRVDVAAILFDPDESYLAELHLSTGEVREVSMSLTMGVMGVGKTEVCPIQKYLVPSQEVENKWLESVEVTEELFIPGYPYNVQDFYSQPVWKRATIASSVQQGWNREPKFLIDSASKSGMSGSPVLYYSPNGEVRINGARYQFDQDVAILVGVYVGRVGVTGNADPQIGTVWNQSVIKEIVQNRCYEKLPHEIELSDDELHENMQEVLAGCSRKGLENIKNEDVPSRFYVRHRLMEKINGRASLDRALVAVLKAAKDYDGPLVPDE
ncbi:MAG: hypothetical protein ABGX80_03275 [Cobetia sp.]|uniref:hypothetical protein n=1 Tax=Cobetia sp. TaxID=1873876 RepID=UPI003242219C